MRYKEEDVDIIIGGDFNKIKLDQKKENVLNGYKRKKKLKDRLLKLLARYSLIDIFSSE